VSSHPSRITEELSQPGQHTPSGQRCWRTSAKHLASSIKPEKLTKSDAGMMAETPRASRWLLALQPSHQISASCTTQITTLEPDKSLAI